MRDGPTGVHVLRASCSAQRYRTLQRMPEVRNIDPARLREVPRRPCAASTADRRCIEADSSRVFGPMPTLRKTAMSSVPDACSARRTDISHTTARYISRVGTVGRCYGLATGTCVVPNSPPASARCVNDLTNAVDDQLGLLDVDVVAAVGVRDVRGADQWSMTVGVPTPRHSTYLVRPPPISTSPA